MVIQPTLMFLFEVPSILEFCHIQPSLLGSQTIVALREETEKDAWHKTLVEVVGGEFLPLVVDNLSIWTPSSVKILRSIAWISTVRNGLSTGKAFCCLFEQPSLQLYRYNAKIILHFWALHPHSEDDWLQGCSVEEDSCLED